MFLCSLNEVQEVPSLEAFKMGKHAIHLHSTGVTQVSTTFDSEPHHSPHPLHLINPSSSLLRALQERHTAQPQLYCQSIKISMLNLIIVALLLQLRTKNINTTNNSMNAQTTDKANDKDMFRGILSTFMSILYINKYLHKSWTKLWDSYLYSEKNRLCFSEKTEDKPLLEPAKSLNMLRNHSR